MKHYKCTFTILICIFTVFCILTGCGSTPEEQEQSQISEEVFEPVSDVAVNEISYAASYTDVLEAFAAIEDASNNILQDIPTDDSNEAVDESEPESDSSPSLDDFSTTNVQVAGIDEHDIVKTDGEYIYVLRNNSLSIVKASGADTSAVSTVQVCQTDTFVDEETHWLSTYETLSGMYVYGDRVVIVSYFWSYEEWKAVSEYR